MTLKRRLVAHRGNSDHFPENSLQGFQSALDVGACFIETDIQITIDDVAILSHDASLKKITGQNLMVADCYFDEIKDLSAAYTSKFDDLFVDFKLTTLTQLCELLEGYPKVTLFLEIKHECVLSHGNNALDIVLEAIHCIKQQVVLISFNYSILQYAKKVCDLPLGWVWPEDITDDLHTDKDNILKCQKLNPQYVFCDKDALPQKTSQFWQGHWLKAIYTIADITEYVGYEAMGFRLFETNDISGHSAALEND